METRKDIYSTVLQSSINLILNHHCDIFTNESIETLKKIVNLNEVSLAILSRSLNRKYSWLRVDTLTNYLPTEGELELALNELINTDVIQVLQNDSISILTTNSTAVSNTINLTSNTINSTSSFTFHEIWNASSCLDIDEIKVFSSYITNGPVKNAG